METGDFKVGDLGPRLYRFRFARHVFYHYGEPWFRPLPEEYDSYDPPDPPQFLLGNLPADVRDRVLAEGQHGDTVKMLAESGVDRLEWRQPLLHLEPDLLSDDVFQTLNEIAPGSFRSVAQIELFFRRWDEARLYHVFEPVLWPSLTKDADGRVAQPRVADGQPAVLVDECEPPVAEGERISNALSANMEMVLAYPLWLARDDRLLAPLSVPAVTEGFVEAWRSTEISHRLREAHWEHDIEFTASNGTPWSSPRFRWVDVS